MTLREERRREEAPAAYKPIQPVIEAQVEAQMVDVVAKIKPVLTFKASAGAICLFSRMVLRNRLEARSTR
ncbi:MAG: RtcB family protein [Microcoleus sp.]